MIKYGDLLIYIHHNYIFDVDYMKNILFPLVLYFELKIRDAKLLQCNK